MDEGYGGGLPSARVLVGLRRGGYEVDDQPDGDNVARTIVNGARLRSSVRYPR